MPLWLSIVFARPSEPLSPLARYTQWNGVFYMLTGALFYFAPGVLALLPGSEPFAGQEEGYLRVAGMAVLFIGWFYFIGARTNSDRFGLATVVDRLLVPLFLLPLALSGAIPSVLGWSFSLLDPALGIGAWLIWRRSSR
jgi:hypothetical protein